MSRARGGLASTEAREAREFAASVAERRGLRGNGSAARWSMPGVARFRALLRG